VKDKGWSQASRLGIGTSIVTRAGPELIVKGVVRVQRPGGIPVYNFSVEDNRTYYVGKAFGGVWVHNMNLYPFDIRFTQGSMESTFTHGEWAGRSLDEAIEAARSLGRLPDGLSIEVMRLNDDFVTLNNRTLYVAQQAGLNRVPVTDVGHSGLNKVMKLLKDIGVPLPFGVQPRIR